jgi:hypothetical protein
MILSKELELSDAQQISTTANSTNVIDLGSTGTVLGGPAALVRDIGKGEPVPVLIQVETAFATNQPGTLQIKVVNGATTTLSGATTLVETPALAASTLVAGYQIPIQFLPEKITQRYLGIVYTCTNTVATGTVTAAIVMGRQSTKPAGV